MLAMELHIDVDEVLSWPFEKYVGWLAYLNYRHKKAQES